MPTLDPSEHDERIRYWNKIYRGALLFLIILMVGIVSFTAFEILHLTDANQKSAVAAREANQSRQDNLQGYIKCLSLLRFDDPNLLNVNVTRQQVSSALDKCAVKE